MDAKFLSIIADTSGVTMVNKMCPKKQLQKDSAEEFTPDSFSPSFQMDYLCHTAFNIQLDEFSQAFTEANFKNIIIGRPRFFPYPVKNSIRPPKRDFPYL